MPHYKPYSYDQSKMMPIDFHSQLQPGTFEFALNHLVDEADSHPHFTTIAHFISSMGEEITPLFRNALLICSQMGLIGRQMFAVDGYKISSNCAKEWSGTRADSERKKRKLEGSIQLLLRKHRQTDEEDEDPPQMRAKETEAIGRLRAKVKKIERWLETGKESAAGAVR